MLRKSLKLLLIMAALGLLAACSGPRVKLEKCHKQQEYQAATIGPKVRIPEGMEPLDPELRLEIPYGPANTTPVAPGQPCLVDPPSYMDRGPN